MTKELTGSFTRSIETTYRITYTSPDAHQAGGWCAFAPGYGLRCAFQTAEDALADLTNYFNTRGWS